MVNILTMILILVVGSQFPTSTANPRRLSPTGLGFGAGGGPVGAGFGGGPVGAGFGGGPVGAGFGGWPGGAGFGGSPVGAGFGGGPGGAGFGGGPVGAGFVSGAGGGPGGTRLGGGAFGGPGSARFGGGAESGPGGYGFVRGPGATGFGFGVPGYVSAAGGLPGAGGGSAYGSGGCPGSNGQFVEIKGDCFHFSSNGTAVDWQTARNECKQLGRNVDLAELGSSSDEMLMEQLQNRDDRMWFGAQNPNHVEDGWIWVHSKRKLSIHNAFWAPDEPNHIKGRESCSNSQGYGDQTPPRHYINDAPCSCSMGYVCQVFPEPPVVAFTQHAYAANPVYG